MVNVDKVVNVVDTSNEANLTYVYKREDCENASPRINPLMLYFTNPDNGSGIFNIAYHSVTSFKFECVLENSRLNI